jgi:hypothetical protein
MTFTQIRETTFEELQVNAGVVLKTFDPTTFTGELALENILFATSGGTTITDTPEFRDAGEGIDNAPRNMKEFKKLVRREVKISGSKVTFTPDSVKADMAAADISAVEGKTDVTKITPRDTLTDADFMDFWVVGDYGVGGYMAVHIMNALSVSGFNWKTTDQGNGTSDFEYTAHYSIKNQSQVPYEVYIYKPATT